VEGEKRWRKRQEELCHNYYWRLVNVFLIHVLVRLVVRLKCLQWKSSLLCNIITHKVRLLLG
jgi:hypothetical protein